MSMDGLSGNEIITIAVGKCGIYMLNSFISSIMNEHKIGKNGNFTGDLKNMNDKLVMLKNNVYFKNDKKSNKYSPRSLFMDVDKTHVDAMRSSYLGSLICADNFMSCSGADNSVIWPIGHYTTGAECIDECFDTIRRVIEVCDEPQGFQIFHSMSGGWGSGFATLFELKLRDWFPDRCTNNYSVYPSTYTQRQAFPHHHYNFAVYNTILSIHQIIENSDMCYAFDNAKLFHFAVKYCKLQHPTYDDLNWILSQVISGATATLRFHCEPSVNVTMQSFGVCFSPFPRLHFVTLCHSPYFSNKTYIYNSNISSIINNLLGENEVSNVKLEGGKMLNVAFVYRSNDENAIDKMDEYILNVQQKNADDFVKWIPQINVQSSFIYDGDNFVYKEYTPLLSTAIVSTTAIKQIFNRMSLQFAKTYKRKAYLHWYKAEGMDEMEFCEADKNTRDLVTEYQDKQDADDESLYDDDDDEDYD